MSETEHVIPSDIWDAAAEAANAVYSDAFLPDNSSDGAYLDAAITRTIIALAILAERDRGKNSAKATS